MGGFASPLRYPGGKQRLTPLITELLVENGLVGGTYVEPYAGGAGVAIRLLQEGLVRRVYLNDSSYNVFAFWHVLASEPEGLCRRIERASLSVPEWRKQREILRNPNEHDVMQVAFSTLYLNRCNRSGVLSGGVIGGLQQTGKWKMDARFSRRELIRRVEAIAQFSDRIRATNMDAEHFLSQKVSRLGNRTLVYLDPPYFEKSSRLYLDTYSSQDHVRLASSIQDRLKKNWIVSYDAVPQIMKLYRKRRRFLYDLNYSAATVSTGREVMFFGDSVRLPRSITAQPFKVTA
ncbi:MAG: DNA adenine methylase [Fimbriimonadaceae bacterium]